MSEPRLVWLDLKTGEFSSSWRQSEFPTLTTEWLLKALPKEERQSVKLIEYTCLNDEKFDFYDKMKIVTNLQKQKP